LYLGSAGSLQHFGTLPCRGPCCDDVIE
jgi:hypothetical protein